MRRVKDFRKGVSKPSWQMSCFIENSPDLSNGQWPAATPSKRARRTVWLRVGRGHP